jgi:hypothetical protein
VGVAKETIAVVHKLKMLGYNIISVEQVEKSILINEFSPRSDAKYA